MWKKSRYKFADPEISRTFAPAFGNEAVMLDMLLQCICFAGCLPVVPWFSGPAFRKRGPSGRFPSSGRLSKNFRKKTSQNIWQFENNSLPLHPLLRSEPQSRAPKKTSKKVPQKFGGYAKNSLPLQPLSWKTEASQKSDLWWDLHKQYSSTRAKLETVSGKQKNRQYLYI